MFMTNEEELTEIKLRIKDSKEDVKYSTDMKVAFEIHFDRNDTSIKVLLKEVNKNGKVFFINQLCESMGADMELELLTSVLNHITPNKINFEGLEYQYEFIDAARFIVRKLEKSNIKNIVMTKD